MAFHSYYLFAFHSEGHATKHYIFAVGCVAQDCGLLGLPLFLPGVGEDSTLLGVSEAGGCSMDAATPPARLPILAAGAESPPLHRGKQEQQGQDASWRQ